MKRILVILALLIGFYSQAQVLIKEEIQRLDKLKISAAQVNLHDYKVQKDLSRILEIDRKRRTNKTFAIVFTSLAAIGIGAGAYMIYEGNRNDEGYGFVSSFMGTFYIIGSTTVYGGISIPFWIGASKRKRERDRLIDEFNR